MPLRGMVLTHRCMAMMELHCPTGWSTAGTIECQSGVVPLSACNILGVLLLHVACSWAACSQYGKCTCMLGELGPVPGPFDMFGGHQKHERGLQVPVEIAERFTLLIKIMVCTDPGYMEKDELHAQEYASG